MNCVIPTLKFSSLNGCCYVNKKIVCKGAESAACTLIDFARRIHNIDFDIAESPDCCENSGILFQKDDSLAEEAYRIEIKNGCCKVYFGDEKGAHHAAVSLVQLMENKSGKLSLPCGEIEDEPECSFRGVMVDLARNRHETERLYEYADMCCFYKIRYLHLHFTDDQSYTLPSRAFPKLSGDGFCYTKAELQDFIGYAKKRGVEIIPEIDVPGHSTFFKNNYPDVFGNIGIIRADEKSINGVKTIFAELCELFPGSSYIHLGGDEAEIERWTECPLTLENFKNKGYDVEHMEKRELAEIIYATFIKEVCETIISCGKTPIVWEGFAKEVNNIIPEETVVMSWENYYQTTPELQKAGFRLVNCSWNPMYIVAPRTHWSKEEVYNWDVYSWKPVHSGSPYIKTGLKIEPTKQVEGGQLLAWGDVLKDFFADLKDGIRAEQKLIEERVPFLAQNTWHRQKVMSFEEFEKINSVITKQYTALYDNK